MTINKDEMLADLKGLSPKEKIEFILSLATHLIPVLRVVVGTSSEFTEIYEEYDRVIGHGRRWLRGEIVDPDEVIGPIERPSRRPYYSLELAHKGSRQFDNLFVVGSMLTDAIHYAGELQFELVGDTDVPQSLEEKFTDQELVDNFNGTLDLASSELEAEFETFWERRFDD